MTTVAPAQTPVPTTPHKRKSLWRKPWVVPFFLGVAVFLALAAPPYFMGHPRVPLRPGFDLHLPFLIAHISFGSVCLVTAGFQVWPWFRGRFPVAHRWMGRLYVMLGVLPAALTGIVVSVTSMVGVVGKVGNTLLCIVWLAVTYRGYKSARRRQFGDHRRWMIRSFALTTSIVMNRVWIGILMGALMPLVDSYYGGSVDAMISDVAQTSIWISWVVNLLIAEWWLEKGKGKARARRGAGAGTGATAAGAAPAVAGGTGAAPAIVVRTAAPAEGGVH